MNELLTLEINNLREELLITNKFLKLLLNKKIIYNKTKYYFYRWKRFRKVFCQYKRII